MQDKVQAAIDGLGQAEQPHREVDGTNTAVADAAAAVADFVVDVAGGEHGFGEAAQVVVVQPFLHAALATGEFLAYSGIYSKSLHVLRRRALGHTHQTPEMPRDFEFFHELHAA
jgi:hypothetical protein